MSVVTANRTIVPAIWPAGLGRASSGLFDLQVTDTYQYIPETFEGICDWATIAQQEDEEETSLGRRHLIYRSLMLPKERRGSAELVVVVLQGFLGDFNVTPLGNWDRDCSASAAVQYVTLESGGVTDAFVAQVRTLRNIRDFVSAKVGVELEEKPDSESTIFLERSVFTKVRASGDQAPEVRLGNASDPGGHARKMSAKWRVDHLIPTGTRRDNKNSMRIAPTSLRRGDFVEVSAYVDIQLVRRQRRIGTIIKFALTEVVRLWRAPEVRERFERTDLTVSEDVPHLPKVMAVPSIFGIGMDDLDEDDEGTGAAGGAMQVE